MKYKYTGTEEQLIEHGFEISWGNSDYKYAVKSYPEHNAIYIALGKLAFGDVRMITFNFESRKASVKPYIQDLIDANLVEVIE